MTEHVILVDTDDNVIGTMPKMEAHISGKLHRAFSIFIFNTKRELLLQQRALNKYHSAGMWTNTCCSHPRPGENTIAAASRRLKEEMGIKCDIHHSFNFTYQAQLENGLSEHEYDHVFFGISDIPPKANPEEVLDYKYVNMHELDEAISAHPERYTAWLKICFDRVSEKHFEMFDGNVSR